ncbi:MAG: two-component regulator propeller domain-containing protein [Bacteroidota bacterium]
MRKLIFLLLLLPICCAGQHPQLAHTHYGVNDGLPSSEIYDLLEDHDGYIWLATDNGVSRFNGYAFQNFGPKDGLLNNVVFDLYEDATDRIWMSTYKGFYIFDQDTIRAFPYNHLIQGYKNQVASELVHSFFVDQKGCLHASITELGIIQIFPDGHHQLITPPSSSSTANHLMVYQNQGHVLVAAVYNSTEEPLCNLLHYQSNGGKTVVAQKWTFELMDGMSHQQEGDVLQTGQLYVHTGQQAFLINGDELVELPSQQAQIGAQQQLKGGEMYLGLLKQEQSGGLWQFSEDKAPTVDCSTVYFREYAISSILEDQKGGIWLGTNANGIFYVAHPDVKIYDQTSGLADKFVSALSSKNEEEVFIGTKNGVVHLLKVQSCELTSLPESVSEVHDIAYDAQTGFLWLGCHPRTQYYKDGNWNLGSPSRRALKKFDIYPTGEVHGCVAGPFGFLTFDAKTGRILESTEDHPQLKRRYFCTYKDFRGRQWVGSWEGLFQVVNNELKPPAYAHPSFRLRIEEITQLADSTFVIGTKGAGVLLWRDTQLVQIDQSKGLTADMIEKIHVDVHQNIWVGTLNGLNRIKQLSKGQIAVQQYTMADGLPSNEITEIASTQKSLWVGTSQGLAHLPIRPLRKEAPPAVLVIDKVLVNNDPVELQSSNSWSHWQSNVHFAFFAIDHSQHGAIKYRYRLQPTEKWTNTQTPSVGFAALSPNAYRFELQAASKTGQWSPSKTVEFTIHPPFWKTHLFVFSVLLAVMAFLYWMYQNRIRQIQARADMKIQIQSLRQTVLRSQMNPHFIFNCLNSIQCYISDNDPLKATHYLAQFAQLIRTILNNGMQSMTSLESDIDMIKAYIELEKFRMKHPFDCEIFVHPDIDTFELTIPPLLVQPVVENAILHGLSKLNKAGKLYIGYERRGQQLLVTVMDNGPGMSPAPEQSSTASPSHQPKGMEIIQKRLLLHQMGRAVESQLEVTSLAGVPAWGQGTKVVLRIALAVDEPVK